MEEYQLHPDSIRRLFNSVAPSYDLLNRLLSMGRDVVWRREAVRELQGTSGWVLDVATGTGDVAIELIRQGNGCRRVVGIDFSEAMIRGARSKILQKGVSETVVITLADALSLPFLDNTFSASIVAFGLRNVPEKEKALSEMIRVTRHQGKVIVLEFTLPQKGWMKKLYLIYFMHVLPHIGGWISGDRGAYAYLPESVRQFGHARYYVDLMKRSGLAGVTSRSLTGGIASVIIGTKSPL